MKISLYKTIYCMIISEAKYHTRQLQGVLSLSLFFLSMFFFLGFAIQHQEDNLTYIAYIWISLFFTFFIAQEKFLEEDFQKKLFEHFIQGPLQLEWILLSKLIGFWLGKLSWIFILIPLLLIFLEFDSEIIIWCEATLFIGSINFLLVGLLGITLTRQKQMQTSLFVFIVFPFYMPTFIFGILTIHAEMTGLSPWAFFNFELGLCLLYLAIVPFLAAMIIKYRLEE